MVELIAGVISLCLLVWHFVMMNDIRDSLERIAHASERIEFNTALPEEKPVEIVDET